MNRKTKAYVAGLSIVAACFITVGAVIYMGDLVTPDSPIYIDGDAQLAAQASSGNGTAENPYIIENKYIDSGVGLICISIQNTNAFATIRNVTLLGSSSPSLPIGALNISNVNNLLVTNISVPDSDYAITAFKSTNLNLTSNFIIRAGNYGIYMKNCNFTMLLSNTITSTLFSASLTLEDCNHALISSNICQNNFESDFLMGLRMVRCSNLNMTNNTLSAQERGIYLIFSSNNTIHNNTIEDCSLAGVLIVRSSNNLITDNLIINATRGIDISQTTILSENNNYSRNTLLNDSFYISQTSITLKSICSNRIDATNLVRGKPVIQACNLTSLNASAFAGAGQVILANVNDSSIDGLEGPVALYFCKNISIDNVNTSNDWMGLLAYQSSELNVDRYTASEAYYGLFSYYVKNATFTRCKFFDSTWGALLWQNVNTTFSHSEVSSNQQGLELRTSVNSTVLGNNITNNNDYGAAFLQSSNKNLFTLNRVTNTIGGVGLYVINNLGISNNFTRNGFINTQNVYANGNGNAWDGNYWSDYLTQNPNATNDGYYWDTAYNITGDWFYLGQPIPPGYQDTKPLAFNPTNKPMTPTLQIFNQDPTEQRMINISWSNVSGASNYTIYRHHSPINDLNIAEATLLSTLANTTYQDTVPQLGTYWYAVIARNHSGASGISDPVSITVIAYPQAPVLSVLNTPPASTSYIELSWGVVPGAVNYSLYRHVAPITSATLHDATLLLVTTNNSHTDIVPGNGIYYYAVLATNGTGNSPLSNSVSIEVRLPSVAAVPVYVFLAIGGAIAAVVVIVAYLKPSWFRV